MSFWNHWTITVLSWVGVGVLYQFGFVDYLMKTDVSNLDHSGSHLTRYYH